MKSIIKSIKDGNGKRLSKLLNRRVAGRLRPDDLSSSLLEAAAKGNESCVTSLLRAGADPNCVDDDGRTALLLLIERAGATPVIVRELLRAGCNPNRVSNASQQGALHAAARRGYQVCVKMVVAAGGRVDAVDASGQTPLMCAARGGHATIVRSLIQDGANINATNFNGETALHLVTRHANCTDTASELLAAGADPDCRDARQRTPLLLAAQNNRWTLARELLLRGCDANAQDAHSGRCVLHCAVCSTNADTDLIQTLLANGATTNSRDKQWQTPLLAALSATGSARMARVVALLLQSGCDVTATDRDFNTALHIAARDGLAAIVPMVLKAGLDVDLKGANGRTPLMLAALGGHANIVNMLLQKGATTDLFERHLATALHYALIGEMSPRCRQDVVKALIRANCQLDHAAKLRPLLASVERSPLVSQSNTPHIEDRVYTPLEVAYLSQQTVVFVMLLRCGCDTASFQCDRIRSAEDFVSHQRGAAARERLLMLLEEERTRVPTLRELCRRPLLTIFGSSLRKKIAQLPIPRDVKESLNYSELEEIETAYSSSMYVVADEEAEALAALQRMQVTRKIHGEDTPVRIQQPVKSPLSCSSGWRDSTTSLVSSSFNRDSRARQTIHFGSSTTLPSSRASPANDSMAQRRARRPLGRTTSDVVTSPPNKQQSTATLYLSTSSSHRSVDNMSPFGSLPSRSSTKARSRLLNMEDLTSCNTFITQRSATPNDNASARNVQPRVVANANGSATTDASKENNVNRDTPEPIGLRRRAHSHSETNGEVVCSPSSPKETRPVINCTPLKHSRPIHPHMSISRTTSLGSAIPPTSHSSPSNCTRSVYNGDIFRKRANFHSAMNGDAENLASKASSTKHSQLLDTEWSKLRNAVQINDKTNKRISSPLPSSRGIYESHTESPASIARRRVIGHSAMSIDHGLHIKSPYLTNAPSRRFRPVADLIIEKDSPPQPSSVTHDLTAASNTETTITNGISNTAVKNSAMANGGIANSHVKNGDVTNGDVTNDVGEKDNVMSSSLDKPVDETSSRFQRIGSVRSRIPVPRSRSVQSPSPSPSPSPMSPLSPTSSMVRVNGYASPIHNGHGRNSGFSRTRSFRF